MNRRYVGAGLVILLIISAVVWFAVLKTQPRGERFDSAGDRSSEAALSWDSVDDPATAPPPLLADIEPTDGAVVRGTETWVRWSPPGAAAGRVLWHRVGETAVHITDAMENGGLIVRLEPLEVGEQYEYVVEQISGDFVQRSSLRAFSVEGGIVFDPQVVEKTVQRDYDQTVTLTLRNSTDDSITVAAKALNRFDDLPAEIVGRGSVDDPVEELKPGETIDLRLAVFAQDATQDTYEIPVEAAGVVGTARVRIEEPPKLDLAIRIVGEPNPHTLAKTIEIINNGSQLTDLAVHIAEPDKHKVRLEPAVNHGYLIGGGSKTFVVSPILFLEFESLDVQLQCAASGQTQSIPLTFTAPEGKRLIAARSRTAKSSEAENERCTNAGQQCDALPGTPDTGPVQPADVSGRSAGSTNDRAGNLRYASHLDAVPSSVATAYMPDQEISEGSSRFRPFGDGPGDSSSPHDDLTRDGADRLSSSGGAPPGVLFSHLTDHILWPALLFAQADGETIGGAGVAQDLDAMPQPFEPWHPTLRDCPSDDKTKECNEEAKRLLQYYDTIVRVYRKHSATSDAIPSETLNYLLAQLRRSWRQLQLECPHIGDLGDRFGHSPTPSMGPPEELDPNEPFDEFDKQFFGDMVDATLDASTKQGIAGLVVCTGGSVAIPQPYGTGVGVLCGAGSLLQAIALSEEAEAWHRLEQDPPDANYGVVIEPSIAPIFVPDATDDAERRFYSAIEAARWKAACLDAYVTSFERYQGASGSSDVEAMILQSKAMLDVVRRARRYAREAEFQIYEFERGLLASLIALEDEARRQGVGFRQIFEKSRTEFEQLTYSGELEQSLARQGVSQAEFDELRNRVLAVPPDRVVQVLADYQRTLELSIAVKDELRDRVHEMSWAKPRDMIGLTRLEGFAERLYQQSQLASSAGDTLQRQSEDLQQVVCRPGLVEAVQRRASFTRSHRGPFASPVEGRAVHSTNYAAGWQDADRVCFAWHQGGDQVVFAAFDPRGETLNAPQVIGNGRWPRLTMDGGRAAVAWQSEGGVTVRVHDGERWGQAINHSDGESAIAFAPDGTIFAASSTGLWKLEDEQFEQVQAAVYAQPAIAVDLEGQPHVAWQRDGRIMYGDAEVGEGERPSLVIAPDGVVHLAYLSNGEVIVRSLQAGGWTEPQTIPAENPAWPALALGESNETRLTYVGDAEYGPRATWLVRLPDTTPILVPSLEGNVTDAWLTMEFELKDPRERYRGHDMLVTVNDVWIELFEETVPEGRYRFQLDPQQIFYSSSKPAPNRIAVYNWDMNSGNYLLSTGYQLTTRSAWSEFYGFADSPEQLIEAASESWKINHDEPDLVLLANNLDLPIEAPIDPVDFPVTVANLGEADSQPARLIMRAGDDQLATADIPLLKIDEQIIINMRLNKQLEEVRFEIEQENGDFDADNDALDLVLWSNEGYAKAYAKASVAPPPDGPVAIRTPTPNDVQPPWVAGQLPVGAQAIGDWTWHSLPALNAPQSHSGDAIEGTSLHYFIRADERLPVVAGDNLVQYVYLDPEATPRQILLQLFTEGQQTGPRMYWGEDLISLGGEAGKRLGDLPEPGKWVRLRIPVEEFGLASGWVNGILYGQYGGRVYWGDTAKSIGRLDDTPEVMVVSEE